VPHDHDLAEEAEVVGSLIESQGAEAVEAGEEGQAERPQQRVQGLWRSGLVTAVLDRQVGPEEEDSRR